MLLQFPLSRKENYGLFSVTPVPITPNGVTFSLLMASYYPYIMI